MSDHHGQNDDEYVDLFQYWLIIRKRWKLIAFFFVIAVASVAVISFYLPKTYRVNATISLGHIETAGRVVPVANLTDLQQLIHSGSLTKKITTALDLDENLYGARITNAISTTANPNSEKFFIQYDTTEPDLGVRIVEKVIDEIKGIFNKRAENYRNVKNAEIQQLAEEIHIFEYESNKVRLAIEKARQEIDKKEQMARINTNKLNHEKQLALEQIKHFKDRIASQNEAKDKLRSLSALMEQNTQELIKGKSILTENVDQDNILSSLLFANNLQQSINFLSLDNEQTSKYDLEINESKQEIDTLTTETKTLEEKIAEIQITTALEIHELKTKIQEMELQVNHFFIAEISKIKSEISGLESQMALIENVETIIVPDYLSKPIKPQKRLMVTAAGTLGIFVGLFVAFFIEWQQVNLARSARPKKRATAESLVG